MSPGAPLRRSTWQSVPPTRYSSESFFSNLELEDLENDEVPKSYSQASSAEFADFWMPGIPREHEFLTRNQTWDLVDLEENMHVLPWKYIFKVKNGGTKVRLVVLGCRQLHGID